jgi:hypothetical protein
VTVEIIPPAVQKMEGLKVVVSRTPPGTPQSGGRLVR